MQGSAHNVHRHDLAVVGKELSCAKTLGQGAVQGATPLGYGVEADVGLKGRSHPEACAAHDGKIDPLLAALEATVQAGLQHEGARALALL